MNLFKLNRPHHKLIKEHMKVAPVVTMPNGKKHKRCQVRQLSAAHPSATLNISY